MKRPRQRRFSLTRSKHSIWALPAFGVLLIVAVWAAAWLQLRATEHTLSDAAIRETERFVTSFQRFTQRNIEDADQLARLIKYEMETRGMVNLAALVHAGVIDNRAPLIVSVADPSGSIIARSQAAGPFNIEDRDYFRLHAREDTARVDISTPVVSRVSGEPTILLSRRINLPDGGFAGLAMLSVTPEYFVGFGERADEGTHRPLGLLGDDGVFRARRVGADGSSLSDADGTTIVASAAAARSGVFEARDGRGGDAMRIVAWRKLDNYPFIVTAAQPKNEPLGELAEYRRYFAIAAIVATFIILVFFTVVTVLAFRLQRHRSDLKAQRRFLETLVDNVPSGLTVRSMRPRTAGQYVLWNESNALILGQEAAATLGKTVSEVFPAIAAAEIMELDRQMLASPMVQEVVQVRDVPGRGRRTYDVIRAPIFGDDGRIAFIMASATDSTEVRAKTDELRLASKVFETTADGIMLTDRDDRIIMVNPAFTMLTGFAADELLGLVLAESPFRPTDIAESEARMQRLYRDGYVTREVTRLRKDGTPLALWLTATCVRDADDTILNHVRVFSDISLLKETQSKLEQLASFDTLTGLPNRRLLQDRLEQALLRSARNRVSMALMFIDLDGFKEVNDTLGHDVGDLLLREVALRLADCARASDTIGRFGGDEFLIVLEDAVLPEDAAAVGARIVAALAAPFHLNGQVVRTAASIGIAIAPADGATATILLKNADMAMYEAKRGGRNRYAFHCDVPAARKVGPLPAADATA